MEVGAQLNKEQLVAVRFIVRDTGAGIEANDFDKLFQSFIQIDSGNQKRKPGTGIDWSYRKRLWK